MQESSRKIAEKTQVILIHITEKFDTVVDKKDSTSSRGMSRRMLTEYINNGSETMGAKFSVYIKYLHVKLHDTEAKILSVTFHYIRCSNIISLLLSRPARVNSQSAEGELYINREREWKYLNFSL